MSAPVDRLLAAHGDGEKMALQGDRRRPAILLDLTGQRFVTVIGGYYLFVPGIAALGMIAQGSQPRGRLLGAIR